MHKRLNIPTKVLSLFLHAATHAYLKTLSENAGAKHPEK